MSPDDFRQLALELPDIEERAHMGHPDFRVVGGKIFATLGYPDPAHGMVKLAPEEQAVRVEAAPEVFAPVSGGWGRGGATLVNLEQADEATVRDALAAAWRRAAPKRSLAKLN